MIIPVTNFRIGNLFLNENGELCKIEQLLCRDCRYIDCATYHDKMWCRDCRQKDRFTVK